MTANLKLVGKEPSLEEPAPDLSYEAEQRRRIMSRDWSKVHVTGDRAPAISLPTRRRWSWS
jgi:hypothetical protein